MRFNSVFIILFVASVNFNLMGQKKTTIKVDLALKGGIQINHRFKNSPTPYIPDTTLFGCGGLGGCNQHVSFKFENALSYHVAIYTRYNFRNVLCDVGINYANRRFIWAGIADTVLKYNTLSSNPAIKEDYNIQSFELMVALGYKYKRFSTLIGFFSPLKQRQRIHYTFFDNGTFYFVDDRWSYFPNKYWFLSGNYCIVQKSKIDFIIEFTVNKVPGTASYDFFLSLPLHLKLNYDEN